MIKRLLQRWLKINNNPSIQLVDLRKMIGEAVVTALAGQGDEHWNEYYGGYRSFGNTLTNALEKASDKAARYTAKDEIDKRINTEEFIDSVVERIKNKQLQ